MQTTYKFRPCRGPLKSLPKNIKERANELIYVTDINKLGVIDSWGFPQLLVDVVDCKNESEFPNIESMTLEEKGKLYYSIEDDSTSYFDLRSNSFMLINIVLSSVIEGDLSLKKNKK